MLLGTIALIVLFAAIFVMFNEELQGFGKKFIESKKVRLLLPLFIASYLALLFEEELYQCLVGLRIFAFSIIYFISKFARISIGYLVIEKSLFLIMVAFLPIILAKLLDKIRFFKQYNIVTISKHVNVFLWTVFALLVVVSL